MMRKELVQAEDKPAIENAARKFIRVDPLGQAGGEALPGAEHPREGLYHDAGDAAGEREPWLSLHRIERLFRTSAPREVIASSYLP